MLPPLIGVQFVGRCPEKTCPDEGFWKISVNMAFGQREPWRTDTWALPQTTVKRAYQVVIVPVDTSLHFADSLRDGGCIDRCGIVLVPTRSGEPTDRT